MTGNLIATFALEDADDPASQDLQGRLWALGCSGLWERESGGPGPVAEGLRLAPEAESSARLDAYFVDDDWSLLRGAELSALAGRHGARFLGLELLLERDWMATHRQLAQPRVVADFLIDPREPHDSLAPQPSEADTEGARWRIRVPARQAFGTGSHETTRLTLLALTELEVSGSTVIDVGCGSGVLSFAAHHLGAARVFGYDVDPVAAFAARVNAGLNRISLGRSLRFVAGTQEMLLPGLGDVLLVNVLPEKIEGSEPALQALLRGDGIVILSGLLGGDPLPESTSSALERWRGIGWSAIRSYQEGEWVAYRMVREASEPRRTS